MRHARLGDSKSNQSLLKSRQHYLIKKVMSNDRGYEPVIQQRSHQLIPDIIQDSNVKSIDEINSSLEQYKLHSTSRTAMQTIEDSNSKINTAKSPFLPKQ